MKEFSHIIRAKDGLHMRCAGLMVQHAKAYKDTTVSVTADGKTATTAQIFRLLSMRFTPGAKVTVAANGAYEEPAIQDMQRFFAYYL